MRSAGGNGVTGRSLSGVRPKQLPKGLPSSLGFSGDAMLTAETVRKLLDYDPETGVFRAAYCAAAEKHFGEFARFE